MKVARIATVPSAFVHIKDQINHLHQNGAAIDLISSKGDYWKVLQNEVGNYNQVNIEISRNISPLKDIATIVSLFKRFKSEKYDIVHSTTPKAGLLVAIAAFLAAVPVRMHTFTGQRWATMKPPMKWVLISLDWLISKLNTIVYADSDSQANLLVHMGIIEKSQIKVIHKGSLGGIDIDKYQKKTNKNFQLKEVPVDDIKLIFLGRVCKDKGINELISSFINVQKKFNSLSLMLVGPIEDDSAGLTALTLKAIKTHPKIYCSGFVSNPQDYLMISDLLCLPSYREGFGTVILEAAVFKVPTLGTKISGLVDAIVDGETGILVDKGSEQQLEIELLKLVQDKDFRSNLGTNAHNRLIADFQSKKISNEVYREYQHYLELIKK